MRKLITLCLILISSLGWAEIIKAPIHSIDRGGGQGQSMIRFENGRVAFISSTHKLVVHLQASAERGDVIEARVDDNQVLISFKVLQRSSGRLKNMSLIEGSDPINFQPTVIPNYKEADKIFNRLNPNWRRSSECSNRAHVWAHEEYNKYNIKSEKAFIFFTASYINRNRFKWWFHVAPMLTVNENGQMVKRVLDVMFNHQPVTIKEWTDNFIFSKRPCKVTTKFSEYDVNPQTEDCYFITSPMYYWVPSDIHREETHNSFKGEFPQSEISAAYGEAF